MKELQAIRTRTNIQGLYFGRIWKKTKWPPEMNTRMLLHTRSRSLPAHLSMTNIKSYGRSCENRGFTLNFSTNMWKKILY